MSIRIRLRNEIVADDRARAGTIVDDHALAQADSQVLAEQTREQIVERTRRKRHDEPDGPVRVARRRRHAIRGDCTADYAKSEKRGESEKRAERGQQQGETASRAELAQRHRWQQATLHGRQHA